MILDAAGAGLGRGRGEERGRVIWVQVQPPTWMYPAWPVARARAMPGSAVQACWTLEEPSSPYMPASNLVAVSTMRRVPARWEIGSG